MDIDTRCTISQYLKFIQRKASGELYWNTVKVKDSSAVLIMPDKANFTPGWSFRPAGLGKKRRLHRLRRWWFCLSCTQSNQLGRLVISQRKFQPGKRYGFYWCGFRLWLVKEEIRQLSRGRIPYYMNHNRKPPRPHPPLQKKTSTQVSRKAARQCSKV